jgi:ubiquinone/menaquinone biosynthesis C-methylase UbiE
MGERRKLLGPVANGDKRPIMSAPLEELIHLAEKRVVVPLDRFFTLVNDFATERRKQHEALDEMQEFIFQVYNSFSPSERVRFFAMLYDRFAERYDEHMAETGHYHAIRQVMVYALPYLRTPMLDITAGTGEPLKYAIEFMEACTQLPAAFGILVPKTSESGVICANEISPRMLEIAQAKLRASGVDFTLNNAFDLPESLRGRFRTVLCSQTFHLIADEDKQRLVRSIHEALVPGGIAVVMEEDPFRITPTTYIEPISLFLRAVVRPIRHRATLVAYFENNDFTKLEHRAVAPIDSEHSMRLHLFEKKQ